MMGEAFKMNSKNDLPSAADWLLQKSGGRKKWFFFGEMGTGKTTVIGVLCELLGAKGKTSSPTFSIINRYVLDAEQAIFHLDLFRLKTTEEAIDIGIEDILYDDNFAFIEWPELLESIAPPESLFKIQIESTGETARLIQILA